MVYLIPILTALLNRMVGGGLIIYVKGTEGINRTANGNKILVPKTLLPDIPKPLWLALMSVLAFICTQDIGQTAAWALTFACLRFPPTQGLFSAINGNLPTRKDSWYWPMTYLPDGLAPTPYALWYGVARGLVCLIGVIALYVAGIPTAPLFMIPFMAQGVIYWLGGKIGGAQYGSTVAELSLGFMVGVLIL